VAHDKGKRVRIRQPIRLDRSDPGCFGVLKHHAAVLPAIQSARKVIPEKAVEEWPEGKDFLPSKIDLAFLKDYSGKHICARTHKNGTLCKSEGLRPIYSEKGNLDAVDLPKYCSWYQDRERCFLSYQLYAS
jgi:hypothetical protein